jgi:hypothetical protein
MHFGAPVVPEENRMYSGWSKGSRTNSIGTSGPLPTNVFQLTAPRIGDRS